MSAAATARDAAGFFAAVDLCGRRVQAARGSDAGKAYAFAGASAGAATSAIGPSPGGCEAITLRHATSLAYPTADVAAIDARGEVLTVTSTFFGLTGSVSPLPDHLTEGWSQQEDASALHALFDRWHHRLLQLMYCSVRKYSPAHAFCDDAADAWSQRLLQWTPAATPLPAWRRLRAWTVLAGRQAGSAGLQGMLAELLAAHVGPEGVVIEPMTGGLEPLCAEQHMRLGVHNAQLAEDAILGAFVEAPASAYRVWIGPLSKAAHAWLTRVDVLVQLLATLELFTPPGIRAEVVVKLEAGAHPPQALFGARLGRDTWLGAPDGSTVLPLVLELDAPAEVGGDSPVGSGGDGETRENRWRGGDETSPAGFAKEASTHSAQAPTSAPTSVGRGEGACG